ncbi:Putative acyl-acyl carrier protein (ACP) thioesterase [Alteracholeplasma palmae J233]|uniref:Putative acyl-acyl carrier protein (ACP) thioesterase n=1 Tax=Alteracholeplasma palmae (strain ATCC 49389 / J233) TaxID=1318466 RepID=U4KQD6_ALTPJ|nr:acyl-ACP thioesterase domain-containing protein [Alteracholeplasma palmae]CCV64520.1 Putative acyl-acyl carrier protein (ACP) thioesterase [Alteracholeplasma palmae J233]
MYKTTYQILSSQIGPSNKLKLFDLINILQDVEGLHIDQLGEFSTSLKDNNLGIYLSFRQVNIKKWPKLFDTLHIETYPYDTKGYFGYRNTIIYNDKKEVIAETYCLGTFMSLDTLRPTKINQEIIDTLDQETRYDMEYLPRKIGYNKDNYLSRGADITVDIMHIDSYLHMNNAFYIAFAESLLPENYTIGNFRAEYKKPVLYKEVIHAELYKEESFYIVVIKNENNDDCAIIEFR